jgi:hypothetical protein
MDAVDWLIIGSFFLIAGIRIAVFLLRVRKGLSN